MSVFSRSLDRAGPSFALNADENENVAISNKQLSQTIVHIKFR